MACKGGYYWDTYPDSEHKLMGSGAASNVRTCPWMQECSAFESVHGILGMREEPQACRLIDCSVAHDSKNHSRIMSDSSILALACRGCLPIQGFYFLFSA